MDGDLPRRVDRLEEDMGEVRAELKALRQDMTEIKVALAKLDGRVAGIEGRLTSIEGRFSQLPTTIQLGGFVIAIFLAAGVMRWMDRPSVIYAPPPGVSAPR